jgi:hypothetical protein
MHPKRLNSIENIALNFENDHSCFRHINVGFGGMRVSTTNLVLINEIYCYEKKFLNKGLIAIDTKTEIKTIRNYLIERHPRWIKNIGNMELNFGNLPINNIENSNMKSAWINSRKALFKHFNTLGSDIKDQPNYSTECANLEDKRKMLKEDHKPTWLFENIVQAFV